MILTCPNCSTRYQTDAVIQPPGRNVRCAKCGQIWFQGPPEPEPEPALELDNEAPAEAAHEHAYAEEHMHEHGHEHGHEQAHEHDRATSPAAAFAPRPYTEHAHSGAEPRRRSGSGFFRAIAWAVLIVVIIAIVFALIEYRQTIATMWPKTASLYSTIGMKVNVLGLDIRDVTPSQTTEAGAPLLEVRGRVVNVAGHRIPVPKVRMALFDSENRELYKWVFDSGVGVLDPGATGDFVTRLPSPPREAKNMTVRFVEAGEP
jgi:predicted Zn finger-like uncharacterized protein